MLKTAQIINYQLKKLPLPFLDIVLKIVIFQINQKFMERVLTSNLKWRDFSNHSFFLIFKFLFVDDGLKLKRSFSTILGILENLLKIKSKINISQFFKTFGKMSPCIN